MKVFNKTLSVLFIATQIALSSSVQAAPDLSSARGQYLNSYRELNSSVMADLDANKLVKKNDPRLIKMRTLINNLAPPSVEPSQVVLKPAQPILANDAAPLPDQNAAGSGAPDNPFSNAEQLGRARDAGAASNDDAEAKRKRQESARQEQKVQHDRDAHARLEAAQTKLDTAAAKKNIKEMAAAAHDAEAILSAPDEGN
ncbi:MAG: hypothetical protein JWM78_1003 [Verrucomicrobiaceae bacterium]|nr:hypothetical protein [Verrucomicrobiaceae bacterium]